MYHVIYDISENEYHFINGYLIVSILVLAVMIGTLFYTIESYKMKKKRSVYRSILFMIFLSYFLKFFSMLYWYTYQRENTLKLEVNQSQEVVGEIEQFIPLRESRNQPCSFQVNGIKFQLYPAARTGALRDISYPLKDGDKVRIQYLYDNNYKMNLILKLEISKE